MAKYLTIVIACLSMLVSMEGFTYKTKNVYFSTDGDERNDVRSGVDSEVDGTDSVSWFDNRQKTINLSKGKCHCRRSSPLNQGCQCCISVSIKTLPKMEACAEFEYDSSAKALDFTVTINREMVARKRISVTMDTKFCHNYEMSSDNATVCLGLRKISLEEGHAGACMFMQIESGATIHWDQNIGCIYKRNFSAINIV